MMTSLETFRQFSASHLTALLLITVLNLAVILFGSWIRQHPGAAFVPKVLGIMLLVLELSAQFWYLWSGTVDVRYTLPLHLCDLSLILSALMLLTGSDRLYGTAYFMGLAGSTQALLTPNLVYPFPHFLYFQFFLSHGLVVAACLWATFVGGKRPTFRQVWIAFGATNLYALVIFPVNLLLGSDYLFINGKPSTPSLLDFLGPWPWYILSLEALCLGIFLLLWLPFRCRQGDSGKR